MHITITTPDAALARLLEPRAPRPDLRFAAVRRLREAGIIAGILCCPLLPGITDSEAAIDDMARRAAEAGASFFAANPLFLKACSRPTYLSFVREHFSSQLADTQRRFALRDFAAPSYAHALARIVARACEKHGLHRRSRDTTLTKDTIFNSAPALRQSTQRTRGFERKPAGSANAAPVPDGALRLSCTTNRSYGRVYGCTGGAPCVNRCSRNSWKSVPIAPSATPSSVSSTVTCTSCRSLWG